MTEIHPVGSTVPVQPWLIDSIRRRAQSNKKAGQARAARDRYLVERFQAWRIFPVRIGRWQRVPVIEDPLGDAVSAVLFPFFAPFRTANWQQAYNLIQVLDPATGRPISEIRMPSGREGWTGLTDVSAVAFLGDPRVAGLITPVGAGAPEGVVPFAVNRRSRQTEWRPETFDQEGPRLAAEPYRDFADRDDGPWLADHAQKPKKSNRWKPSPWYQPS